MSRSPERISSYRRHFEDSSSSSYQVRVSSPSPVRRDVGRCRSASYSRNATAVSSSMAVSRRTISSSRGRSLMNGVGNGAICLSGGGPGADLDQAAAENREFLSTRTSERQEMILLNDRLAVYIEKVRTLEQQNKLLETEIEALTNRYLKPTGLRLLYEEQLKELKRLAEQMRVQRDQAIAAKDAVAAQLEMIKIKYEEALEMRRKAELDIEAFRPDVDAATSARIALEKQLENLEVELEFLQRVHKQEIDELMKQIYAAHATAMDAYSLPDLSAALKQIQHQYDDIAAKNLEEMDSWYKTKFDDLNNKTSKHVDRLRSVREGIAGAKKEIQNKERDFDSMKTKNEALEAQIREAQEKYRKELEELQARIEALQLELKSSKQRTALLLREYQDLLNVKMALEIEITTYRKLIEGEDSRLTSMVQNVQTLSLMSGSTSVHSTGVTGVADRSGRGLAGGLGDGASMGLGGGAGGGLAQGHGVGLDGVLAGGHGGSTKAIGGGTGSDLDSGLGGGGPGTGLGGYVGSDPASVIRGGIGGDPASGIGGGVVSGLGSGLGEGVGSGPGTGLGVGVGGGPAKGIGGGIGGDSAKGIGEGIGGDPASCLGGSVGGGPGTGIGGDVGGGPGTGIGGGVGGGAGTGIGGGVGGGAGTGIGGVGGGTPGTGFGGGVGGGALGTGIGGVGVGLAGGLGAGDGRGVKGGLINGITGVIGASSTTLDYTEAQAVEMTERKTVLIRTIKTEDDILESSTQEKSYSISGAADDEE